MKRKPKKKIAPIEYNEDATLPRQSRAVELNIPTRRLAALTPLTQSAVFGLWKDRVEFANPSTAVRRLRKGRYLNLWPVKFSL